MHPNGSSSGGAGVDENSAGGEKKHLFLPNIVNYEDLSRKSMKKNLNSAKNLNIQQQEDSAH